MSNTAAAWGEPHLNAAGAGSVNPEVMKAAQSAARGNDQERTTDSDVDAGGGGTTEAPTTTTTTTAPNATTATDTDDTTVDGAALLEALMKAALVNREEELRTAFVKHEKELLTALAKHEEELRTAFVKHEKELLTALAKREEELLTALAQREEVRAAALAEEQKRIENERAEEQRRIANELSRTTLRILYANLDGNQGQLNRIEAYLPMEALQQFDVLVFAELTNVGVHYYIEKCGFDRRVFCEEPVQHRIPRERGTERILRRKEVSIYVTRRPGNGLNVTSSATNPRSATVTVAKKGLSTTITGVHWAQVGQDDIAQTYPTTFTATFGDDPDPRTSRWVIVGDFNQTMNTILNNFGDELQVRGTADQPLPATNNNYQIKPPTDNTENPAEGVPTTADNIFDHVFASPLFRSERPQEGQYTWRCRVINRPDLYKATTAHGGTVYGFNHPMLEVQIPLI